MRYFLCIAALMRAATASASGLSGMSEGWTFREQGGAAIYVNVCAACHQAGGQGAAGAAAYPALAKNPDLASADYVEIVVLAGKNAMPPLGGMLSDTQIADVAAYVRTHFGNDYPEAVSPASVAAARAKGANR
jgi:mono/diheme cytochrome c family protein